MTESPSAERHRALLIKYVIPDMGDHSAVGGILSSILDRLDRHKSVSAEDKAFIRAKGLFDLYQFVKRLEETGREDFSCLRGPRRKMLWEKYDIGFIKPNHVGQMMRILEQVEVGTRVADADVLWLVTNNYRTDELKRAIHKIEAHYFRRVFEETNDPWAAVNASSNFRKADSPLQALGLLNRINISKHPSNRLKSALYTTKGGALRDQGKYEEALHSGMEAHNCDAKSFHPCTLVGAVHCETGNVVLGEKWFAMAVERGATPDAVNSEIRVILHRLRHDRKKTLIEHLLKADPLRYAWLVSKKTGRHSKRRNLSRLR